MSTLKLRLFGGNRLNCFGRICMTMFLLGWLNFVVFCYIGQRIGGEALHGKIDGGHYYLATGYISGGIPRLDAPHNYIEVSQSIFRYSQIHCYSVLVAFPLGLISGLLAAILGRNRKHEISNAA